MALRGLIALIHNASYHGARRQSARSPTRRSSPRAGELAARRGCPSISNEFDARLRRARRLLSDPAGELASLPRRGLQRHEARRRRDHFVARFQPERGLGEPSPLRSEAGSAGRTRIRVPDPGTRAPAYARSFRDFGEVARFAPWPGRPRNRPPRTCRRSSSPTAPNGIETGSP
jgi:hypothetical protein